MDITNKKDFEQSYWSYADSMTGSDLTDDELFKEIKKEIPELEEYQIHWLVELIRWMEERG